MISPPEGFSYYALHPLDFGRLALGAASRDKVAAVIGIRSIGTTLSAVVSAALIATGVQAQRITVRPIGHPYDRVLQWNVTQIAWIKQQLANNAQFLIVDEGPGRSGSTFLAVAEALVEAGVALEQITLLGSRHPDPGQLCAKDGARRWSQFRFVAVEPDPHSRFRNYTYVGGGDWRHHFLRDVSDWPACWPQMERLKFLSPDGRRFWKFEGLGRVGAEVQSCSRLLAEAAFSPRSEEGGEGFANYEVLQGIPLSREHLTPSILNGIAQYCAFRASELHIAAAIPDQLASMVSFNAQQQFGIDLRLQPDELATTRSVLADGHMQPHEWVATREGLLLKTDACTHGNDHFFPGPCDIAWDLAGAAIEWDLPTDAVEQLLSQFQTITGDRIADRFPAFALAYAVFRLAWCKMALPTVVATNEEPRIRRAYIRYRKQAEYQVLLRQSKQPGDTVILRHDVEPVAL